MELGLQGKVAFITGGSQGIGEATAYSMASEGARVAICARDLGRLQNVASDIKGSTGADILVVQADVTSLDNINNAFDQVISKLGQIDILVNNAGKSQAMYFEDADDVVWQDDLDLKLFAAIRCARLVVPYMKKQGGGRIINVTNLGGKAPGKHSVPTSVSRAAGIALTKALSRDYASDNILVNAVCIGSIKSGQHEKKWQQERISNPDLTLEKWYEHAGSDIPLGRVGETSEAADVITFLASNRASYITGVAVNIDGGMSPVV